MLYNKLGRSHKLPRLDLTLIIIHHGYSPTVQDESDIIGQDGHIYKGRSGRRLPPIGKVYNCNIIGRKKYARD